MCQDPTMSAIVPAPGEAVATITHWLYGFKAGPFLSAQVYPKLSPADNQYMVEEYYRLIILWNFYFWKKCVPNRYDQLHPKNLGGIILIPTGFYLAFIMKWVENLILDNSILKLRCICLLMFFLKSNCKMRLPHDLVEKPAFFWRGNKVLSDECKALGWITGQAEARRVLTGSHSSICFSINMTSYMESHQKFGPFCLQD